MTLPTDLSHAQIQRLTFIDFCLEFFGQLSRGDLLQQFQTGVASATRDLALYRQCAPHNMELRHQTKLHYRTPEFKPLFEHDAENVLRKLSMGCADDLKLPMLPGQLCLDAVKLISAPSGVVATLMRAITQKQAVLTSYVSLSSGEKQRELVPHALINSGLRWHARCFDRNSQSFRDFVCTRFLSAEVISEEITQQETSTADEVWNRIHKLKLIPHPGLQYPKAVELDYGMQNGVLELELREILLGYVTRQWRVDCSADRYLDPLNYPLALAEPELVAQLKDNSLLPGAATLGDGT